MSSPNHPEKIKWRKNLIHISIKAWSILLLMIGESAYAGIDGFTRLDQINGWEIERKIDSETQKIVCRASIPNYYAWFGGKIRISKSGELVIPEEFSEEPLPLKTTINEVKKALKACEAGLIYKIYAPNEAVSEEVIPLSPKPSELSQLSEPNSQLQGESGEKGGSYQHQHWSLN